jgi:hypothetical protein
MTLCGLKVTVKILQKSVASIFKDTFIMRTEAGDSSK